MKYALSLFFLLALIAGCEKDQQEEQAIRYLAFENPTLHFPVDPDSVNTLEIPLDPDTVPTFTLKAYHEAIHDFYNPDSIIAYRKIAHLSSDRGYDVPVVHCHTAPGACVSVHEGDTIDASVVDCFPSFYEKCSCAWVRGCYISRVHEGGCYITADYLPLKYMEGDRSYYGWLKLEVKDSIVVKEMGVSLDSDRPVRAGDH